MLGDGRWGQPYLLQKRAEDDPGDERKRGYHQPNSTTKAQPILECHGHASCLLRLMYLKRRLGYGQETKVRDPRNQERPQLSGRSERQEISALFNLELITNIFRRENS